MPFTIIRQDITTMNTDAIVNAANTNLQMGGGVCGAIFSAAGVVQMQAACSQLAPIQTGEAVMTPGFHLPAKFVIHAAGPIYRPWNQRRSARYLRAAYTNALKKAVENGCESIAFPLISSGTYGYPKREALQVAISAIQDFLTHHDMEVTLAVYDKSAFAVSRKLIGAVESYIGKHHEKARGFEPEFACMAEPKATYRDKKVQNKYSELFTDEDPLFGSLDKSIADFESMPAEAYPFDDPDATLSYAMPAPAKADALDDLISNLDEPFSQMLLRLIDAKGMTDIEVYKRANIDRKLFSKIRTGKGYMPGKRTAIALAIALRLSLLEADAFLERAGYALSRAVKFDVIVEYFITNNQYDIFEINEVLFAYDQPLLGS